MANQHSGQYRIFSRLINVLRTEGLHGIFRRIKGHHSFVLTFRFGPKSDPSAFPAGLDPASIRAMERSQRFLNSFEFKQLTSADIGEIDELTDFDPWKVPKSVTLERLQEGWHCYVAKNKGRVVANSWTKAGPEFVEPLLERSITLADDEVYGWRAFCVPVLRGRGVLPWLTNSIVKHLALTEGVKSITGWVLTHNKAMLHTQVQMGWSVVGRIGYIDFFGFFRLHYLWGRKAFSLTRKRIFFQRSKRTG